MKPEIENNIRDAENHRDTRRQNLASATAIKVNVLRIRSEHGDQLSGALADALEAAEHAADYDLEISAYEYSSAVFAVQDAYAGDESEGE